MKKPPSESTGDKQRRIINEFYEANTAADGAAWWRADLALGQMHLFAKGAPWECSLEKWKGLSAEVGKAPSTLRKWTVVAWVFPPDDRKWPDEYLTFEHHRLCVQHAFRSGMETKLCPTVARLWLDKAADNNWSVAQLKRAIAEETGTAKKVGKCPHARPGVWCAWQHKGIEVSECENCQRPELIQPK